MNSVDPKASFNVSRAVAQDVALLHARHAGLFIRARDNDSRPHSQSARIVLLGEGASQATYTDSLGGVLLVPRFVSPQTIRMQRIGLGTITDTVTPRLGFVDTVTLNLGPPYYCLGRVTTG